MSEIRLMRMEDMEESLDLSCFAFQYELTAEEREARKAQVVPGTIWGHYVDGRLAAKMTIHPMEAYVSGRRLPIGGVASVATWPEYRRQGLVRELLLHGLDVMRRQGQSLSILHPFSIPFYRKYGWELYTDYMEVELEASQLPRGPEPSGSVERVARDGALLAPIYAACAVRYNGMLARSEAWWKQSVFKRNPGQTVIYRNGQGEATGYLLYEVKTKALRIGEFMAADTDAWYGLWRFIANHDSMFERIRLRTSTDDPLAFLLQDPRAKRVVEPYFMARIVDVEAFLGLYAFSATGRFTQISLHVEDEQADWNNRTFELQVDSDGQGTARAAEGPDPAERPDVRCRISVLTSLLLGYRRPSELHRYGLLIASPEMVEQLEQLVPRQAPYLSDYF